MTSFDPRTTAIVAVHFQNDIVGPDGAFAGFFRAEVERTGVLDTAARLLDGARAAGVPVIYTRVAWKSDYSDLNANSALLGMVAQTQCLQDGSEGAAITDEVTPRTATGSSPTSASAGSPTATSRRPCGPRALRPSSSPAWPPIGRGHRPRGVGPRLPHRRRRRRLLGRLPGGAQRLAGVPRSARRDHHHRGVPRGAAAARCRQRLTGVRGSRREVAAYRVSGRAGWRSARLRARNAATLWRCAQVWEQ